MGLNTTKIRQDFPLLHNQKKPSVYLDSACMSLKPMPVIEKMNEYYKEYPACAGRSHHRLGKRASEEYDCARVMVKKFINARAEQEIIFTRNATEGFNLVAHSLDYDVVITSDKEHNSNLVPWIVEKQEKGIVHEVISTEQGFDLAQFTALLQKHKNKKILVSIVHTSNMDGTTNPVKEIIKLAHEYDATVMIDGAQSVPHKPIDVKKLDADLLAFSGHKMLGPTGTGVLYGKSEILEKLKTYNVGGDTVDDTFYDKAVFTKIPARFEAGLQDYAGFIGLGAAIEYLSKYIDDIEDHDRELNRIMTDGLKNDIDILGPPDATSRSSILSFNPKNRMDYHEVAMLLDSYANIAIRSGRHCVHSWFNARRIGGSARASVYLYNTVEEAKLFVEKTKEVLKMK